MKYVPPLNDAEIQTLHEMHRYHPSKRARMRAHSFLLSHPGVSMPHIARMHQADRRSVSCWIDRWHRRGFVGFYDQPGAGRPPRLSMDEQHKVQQYRLGAFPNSQSKNFIAPPLGALQFSVSNAAAQGRERSERPLQGPVRP